MKQLGKKLKLKEKFGKIFGKIGEKKVEKKVETKFYVGTQKVICQWKKSHPGRGWKKLKKSCERSLKKFEIVEISSGKSWKYVGNIGEKKVEKNWEKSVMLKLVGLKKMSRPEGEKNFFEGKKLKKIEKKVSC